MSYNSLLDPTYAELGLFLSIQMTEKSKKLPLVKDSYTKSRILTELTRIRRQLDRIESFLDDFLT